MTRHFRNLSQRARLTEFVFSESGAMSAQKAAQMGAVLAATTLAGILMSAGTAEAACRPGSGTSCLQCGSNAECQLQGLQFCRAACCSIQGSTVCALRCTNDPTNYC